MALLLAAQLLAARILAVQILAAQILTANVLRHRVAFCDHLIEAAIESRQRVGDEIRCVRVCEWCGWRRRRSVHDRRNRRRLRRSDRLRGRCGLRRGRLLREASLRHALELPRQVIETVMHGREAFTEVLVISTVAICSASLPHASFGRFGENAGTDSVLEPGTLNY
ncbi:hypothetical protein [Rhodoplanes sp. Z2-YC6860]|uniref:hypothetical protein n=1 Tax=Rhodoplanes sp. Z2-YC6860 TaxID=674703 RepID=UPI00082AF537|nr:hypothetical protein [Rhodoplanes sp. Z2-YC6860]